MDVLPIARGFRTCVPAQSAGQLNAKAELSKGRQFRPSTPQLCALGLEIVRMIEAPARRSGADRSSVGYNQILRLYPASSEDER
jgi:hypothetical protein